MNEDFVSFDLAKKLKKKGFPQYTEKSYFVGDHKKRMCSVGAFLHVHTQNTEHLIAAPTIYQVLKWLREEKNIDVEIHAEVGMLGDKVYVPFISTYAEFAFETSPDVIRYRQKKSNPTSPLPHEIVPALMYFKDWEDAALVCIEFVLNNLI